MPKKKKEKTIGEQIEEELEKERREGGIAGPPIEEVPQPVEPVQTPTSDEKETKEEKTKPPEPKEEPGTQPAESSPPSPVTETSEDLQSQREEVDALLSSVEDAYREGTLSEDSYQEIKSKNLRKLEEINKKISALPVSFPVKEKPVQKSAPPLPKPKEEIKEEKPKPIETPEKKPSRMEMASEKFEQMLSKNVLEKELRKIEERFSKMELDVEKLKAVVDSIKEMKSTSDERIQRLAGEMGELRSSVFQRETEVKQQSDRLDKIADVINELEPEKIAKDIGDRDNKIESQAMKIEKLEGLVSALMENMKDIKAVMDSIGSLDNLVDVSRTVNKKISQIKSREEEIKKISDKTEKLYTEMSGKLEEFDTFKANQERLDELTKELMKSVDEISSKLAGFATREEVSTVGESFKGQFQPAPLPTTPEMESLQNQKEEIEMLLSSLEEQYKQGNISKEEFEISKEENLKKLQEIDAQMKAETIVAQEPAPQPPSTSPAPQPTPEPEPAEPSPQITETKPEATTPATSTKPPEAISPAEQTLEKTQTTEPFKEPEKAIEKPPEKPKEFPSNEKGTEEVKEEKTKPLEPKEKPKEEKPEEKKVEEKPKEPFPRTKVEKLKEDVEKSAKEKPEEKIEETKIKEIKPKPKKEPKKPSGKMKTMLDDLQDSYEKGFISKEAFERAKQMLEG